MVELPNLRETVIVSYNVCNKSVRDKPSSRYLEAISIIRDAYNRGRANGEV